MISRQHVCDYQVFSNPYTGLAAMILFQAYFDLETLGDRESFVVREEVVSKEKLRKFFCIIKIILTLYPKKIHWM